MLVICYGLNKHCFQVTVKMLHLPMRCLQNGMPKVLVVEILAIDRDIK